METKQLMEYLKQHAYDIISELKDGDFINIYTKKDVSKIDGKFIHGNKDVITITIEKNKLI